MKVVVTETFLHHIPNGAGWIEGIEALGHTCYGLQSHLYSINDIDEQVDVVVFMGMHTLTFEDVVKFKNRWPDTKLVAVCFGFDREYLKLKPYIDVWVEHTYKHDLADKLFLEVGMELKHLPLATSANLFTNKKIQDKVYDVSFVGTFGERGGHGYRDQDIYLDPILKLNPKGLFGGFYNHPNIPAHQLKDVYSLSKINLNFHYTYQKIQTEDPSTCIDFNSRVFDIAIGKNFQLCDHPYVEELFDEGVKYSSKESWMDNYNYYLNNEEARLEMAEKAYQEVLKRHTWEVRMKEFINIIDTL
jgi:hypothetical protein